MISFIEALPVLHRMCNSSGNAGFTDILCQAIGMGEVYNDISSFAIGMVDLPINKLIFHPFYDKKTNQQRRHNKTINITASAESLSLGLLEQTKCITPYFVSSLLLPPCPLINPPSNLLPRPSYLRSPPSSLLPRP